MRLLNTRTLKLEPVYDSNPAPYAVLSHRWAEGEEITFQEWQDGPDITKSGYRKIYECCTQARQDGLKYCWVDTCCIDKTNSSELQESINSMFKWYQGAAVCYAYLRDVRSELVETVQREFRRSEWFTRGWTLQELIAPRSVVFFSRGWRRIGTKRTLRKLISTITGIDEEIVQGADPRSVSVAKRMSWASTRTTKRGEDMAYSLFGLFGVNMPLIYGEGEQSAFMRLQ
jgi:Heterokaryon incompatibility protein (HET)